MKGLKLWQDGLKTKNFQFQDRILKDYIDRSGTAFLVHKYIGPYEQDAKDPSISLPKNKTYLNELSIQDILVLENRDRKYDPAVIELRGCYQVPTPGFDLSQFGIMLSGDMILVEFHMNDHIKKVGRKIMAGDVFEVLHMRDYNSLNEAADPIPKFYVVQECLRPSSGYGPTWYPHIWQAKCTPIMDTQEYRDILHNPEKKTDTAESWKDQFGTQTVTGEGVVDLSGNNVNANAGAVSTMNKDLQITKLVDEAAKERVRKRGNFIRHLYMRPANQQVKDGLIKWVLNDDNVPPNWTGDFIQSGEAFPQSPTDGDYFVRTDYDPECLFRYCVINDAGVWRIVQENWRQEWVPAGRILEGYLQNFNISIFGPRVEDTQPEKQNLADVILPQADFLPGKRED
jgi:hypothetical protein